MATTTFPSTSSHFFELSENRYDINQIVKGVDAAFKRKEQEQDEIIDSPSPSHFHLHTCTIETSLKTPQENLYYWDGPPRPNAAYKLYTSLKSRLTEELDPFVSLDIALPTNNDVVRPGPIAGGQTIMPNAYTPGIKIFLPGAHRKKNLAVLESIESPASKEWMLSATAWDMQNWLHAILSLDPTFEPTRKGIYRDDKKRFQLQSGLQICWIPGNEDENEDSAIDLKLLITINVYMDMTNIFDPLPEAGQDMLGLILHSLISSPTSANFSNETKARAAGLRHFYASLRPAPDLPFNYSAKQLQPKEMSSKLLPFQTRTVRLLLQREQGITERDNKDAGPSDPAGFWKAYDFGQQERRIGYRRLTGNFIPLGDGLTVKTDRKGKGKAIEASPERSLDDLTIEEEKKVSAILDLSTVRGTLLCEEMGLGKTVESIALLLLHRHPLSKPRINRVSSTGKDVTDPKEAEIVPVIDLLQGTPGMDDKDIREWVDSEQAAFAGKKSWDEQAQLDVTEVATTLVVTPPSLLRQWVSEMQRHAPTLRVCVYEGWKSLQKGVEKQRAARMKAAEANKKRQAVAFRNETRNKYVKPNGGGKIKVESGGEDDDDVKPGNGGAEEGTLQVTQRQFVEYVRAHDVVVTTYQDRKLTFRKVRLPFTLLNCSYFTVSQDLKVAHPAPPRSRRSTANYKPNERPRSPLIMVEWWRVIMDEVQLQGDQSGAANMVSLIPRKNSLAVSGTPARADIKDLMGSLKFLRVPVLPFDNRLWRRLQQPSMRPAFEGLFRSISVRTTKKEVSGEFNLPHQARFVVPIELSEIELHYYNDTLERFRERLHLPADPREARPAEWTFDRHLFIVCLKNLRQICTHIQVGQLREGAVPRGERRLHLGRALMTMTEALEKMRNDHTAEFLLDSREQMRKMIRKAQLTVMNDADQIRYLTALNLYEKVRTTVIKQLGPVREHLKNLLGGREDTIDLERDTPDRHQTQQERERSQALTTARQAIREMSIVLHQAWFFEGDVRHIQKQEEEEVNCYAQADLIRKEILRRPLQTANMSVQYLQRQLEHTAAIHDVTELQTEETSTRGGMLSNDIITQANELLEILNDNAYLVFDWRAKILALLSSPIDADTADQRAPGEGQDVEDPEAEYYAEALKAQGEVEAYMIAFAAAIADRKEFLLENRSILAAHDAKQTKQRSTKAAINAMIDVEMVNVPDDVQEQATLLMKERQAFRDARVEKDCERPLKGLLIDLNGPNRPEEITIAKNMAMMLKAFIKEQTEYVDKLNKELDMFRVTFNKRVKYFAALQEISDSVATPESKDLDKDIEAYSKEIDEFEVKLARMVVKGRYLQYLGTREQEHEDIREDCIICFGSSDDNQAVLLQCGHYFCLSCYKEYRKSPVGRKCPSCRMNIDSKEVTRIKLNPARIDNPGISDDVVPKIEEGTNETVPEPQDLPEEGTEQYERERRAADLRRLNYVDEEKMRNVQGMDMLGEYGSKINFLTKHLLYYKSREPDARHVIFSNWSDSLNIVMQALRSNDISFTSFDQGQKQKDVVDRFLKDRTIKVFLLHAEKESSGLTLTSCRVVHLLEPVLRHSFELQAIGRVDRLGQKKKTSVYCYTTLETVESRILSQGVRNGTSIYLDDENADQQVADMPNVASAATRGGDVGQEGNEEDLLGLIL
ncbi:uncharacterized protein IL334_001947 [Kwoniella shivajii]|uniref:E3 ubiquitin-protein ligase SHPRH n=1 Tax=Kwoniella shivajii TaxID=564305 RepID=A0ABZ1CTC7_9TREE|nr:hypothetical protein IL334_001947 [Kwoniella shivajii]